MTSRRRRWLSSKRPSLTLVHRTGTQTLGVLQPFCIISFHASAVEPECEQSPPVHLILGSLIYSRCTGTMAGWPYSCRVNPTLFIETGAAERCRGRVGTPETEAAEGRSVERLVKEQDIWLLPSAHALLGVGDYEQKHCVLTAPQTLSLYKKTQLFRPHDRGGM